ncbi:hypothetical protein MCELHM10_03502 [Paracoccaceae bacterium]
MADLVPSTIGRPYTYMAEFLAGCAGMMDAIATLVPEVLGYSDFVSGDEFFTMAKDWRERPPIETLEARRVERRQDWIESLGPNAEARGSDYTHTNIACMDEVRIRAEQ